ncbi:MAG: hypothetical protein ABIE07_01065 [Candidatus Zixiibacteriota bacterium]
MVKPPLVIVDSLLTEEIDPDEPDPGDDPPVVEGTSTTGNWWDSLWDWMTGSSAGNNPSAS